MKVIFVLSAIFLLVNCEICLDPNSPDLKQEDYIGTWYLYSTTQESNLKCAFYDGLFVGDDFYIVRHEIDQDSKETVLTAHSTADYEKHSYTVHYDYNKRGPEEYSILCFTEDFEINHNKKDGFYNIITRKINPSKEVMDQIDEILKKHDITTEFHKMNHQNCGRCF